MCSVAPFEKLPRAARTDHMELSLAISAFIAGVLTFLAPCTLPLLPGYLGFISGTSIEDLKSPARAGKARWKIFLNGAAFVLGFSIVFVVLGTLVGLVGATVLAPYRQWFSRVGGVFVIIFGLFMLNVIKIPFLTRETHFKAPAFFRRGRPLNSFILGGAFSLGWTPCVGPILGSILLLASTSTPALSGAFLLGTFSLGFAVPFLLIAFSISKAEAYLGKISKYLNIVSVVGGVFMIILGTLVLTDKMPVFLAWSYHLLQFLHYDRLIEYL